MGSTPCIYLDTLPPQLAKPLLFNHKPRIKMDYIEALSIALSNEHLVKEYDRLTGSQLASVLQGIKTGGIAKAIDESSGRTKDEIQKFDQLFFITIWSQLPYTNKYVPPKIKIESLIPSLTNKINGQDENRK